MAYCKSVCDRNGDFHEDEVVATDIAVMGVALLFASPVSGAVLFWECVV